MRQTLKKPLTILILLVILLLPPVCAWSGGFRLRWVEVDVVLDKDGKAQVSYAVRWSCSGADLHGFYFEGFSGEPVFDSGNSYALDQDNNRYTLDIKKLGSRKYDIIQSWEHLNALSRLLLM